MRPPGFAKSVCCGYPLRRVVNRKRSPEQFGTRDVSPRVRAGHNAKVKLANIRTKENVMGNLDQAKGRAKQAVGDLTGDDDLRREGKVDEGAGKAKEKVSDAIDKVKDKVTDRK